jgi:hypothetical protein
LNSEAAILDFADPDSVEQIPAEADSHSASQEMSRFLLTMKIH